MAIVNRTIRDFSDLNFSFSKHPLTNDVNLLKDEDAVKQSVKNLIQTSNYERLFQPELGCQITSLLFENFTPLTVNVMRQTIVDVLDKHEPRCILLNVDITDDSDRNGVEVTVTFTLKNINVPIQVTTFLSRAR